MTRAVYSNVAIFEDVGWRSLLPLTWLRASFELVCGCDRLIDKLRTHLGRVCRVIVRPELEDVVERRTPLDPSSRDGDWRLFNARVLLTGEAAGPKPGVVWRVGPECAAIGLTASDFERFTIDDALDPERLEHFLSELRSEPAPEPVTLIGYPWEPALLNAAELVRQAERMPPAPSGLNFAGVHMLHPERVSIGPGVRIKPGVVLDAEDGPIVIDRGALIEPNAVVQGPAFIGRKSIVRPHAAIRSGTTIGPVCKVGGEVESSIIHGYSNKQHDGFLGHSYVAEWVNLGADTITSDLKNTYGAIRVMLNGVGVESGKHFVGSIVADHAKTGIGTILPTGCVVGAAANVFTRAAVPKFVPSFAWLTDDGMTALRVDKMLQIARTVMGRRDVELTEADVALLERVARKARAVEAAGWG